MEEVEEGRDYSSGEVNMVLECSVQAASIKPQCNGQAAQFSRKPQRSSRDDQAATIKPRSSKAEFDNKKVSSIMESR
jgi:hypothetical protein